MKFTERIKQLREERQLPQRKFLCKTSASQTCLSLPSRSQKSCKQLVTTLDIDTATYCKIEKGERRVKAEQVVVIADLLQTDIDELLVLWLAEQVTTVVEDEQSVAEKALKIAKRI